MRLYLTMSVLMFLVLAMPDGDVDVSVLGSLSSNGTDEVPAIVGDDPDPNPDTNALIAQTIKAEVGKGIDDANQQRSEECTKALATLVKDSPEYVAVEQSCGQDLKGSISEWTRIFVDNMPLFAFLVIPTMAGVFRLLYIFTGRRYLEHLTYLTHNHAFAFFMLMAIDLLRNARRLWEPLVVPIEVLAAVLLLVVMPYYFYRSLRFVYQQGSALTLAKMPVIILLYGVAVALVFSLGWTALALFV